MRKILTTLAAVLVTLAGLGLAHAVEVYSMGEAVTVGKLQYTVTKAWWEKDAEGKDKYLGIEVSVTNTGDVRVQLPPFQLIDGNGRPREVNFSKITWPKMALNPGETLHGKLYFQPTAEEGFRLLVSGGYDEGEFAHVEIGDIG
ncbi:DUF4352 domain-containing protein [Deferrisoma palaeochoriense]